MSRIIEFLIIGFIGAIVIFILLMFDIQTGKEARLTETRVELPADMSKGLDCEIQIVDEKTGLTKVNCRGVR